MNIYRLTHKYAPRSMNIVISSDKLFTDIWNLIVLFQYTCSDIDSSHDVTPAGAATYLIKYQDAMIFNPDHSYDETSEEEIDLYLNWEVGFIDDERQVYKPNSSEPEKLMNEFETNYKFYQFGLYSFILCLISRDHKLFDGSVGCDSSFEMNNKIWEALFSEGVYIKEKVLLLCDRTHTDEENKLSAPNDPRFYYAYNQEKVEGVKHNIGMFLTRLMDKDMLSTKFPEMSIRIKVESLINEVANLLLNQSLEYTDLSEEYRVEWWRCIRLLREVFELNAQAKSGGNKQTLQNINGLIEFYKDAESKYMGS